jgi:hypothetical protein
MGETAKPVRRGGLVELKATCKTGIVASQTGPLAHYSDKFWAYYQDGRIRYCADYQCGNGNCNVIILASADDHYGMCEVCEDAAKGPCVYRCFNAAGDLLYIGSAKAYLRRMQAHWTQSKWWPEVADTKVERFPTLLAARGAELHAIKTENPIENRQRPGRRVPPMTA